MAEEQAAPMSPRQPHPAEESEILVVVLVVVQVVLSVILELVFKFLK